MIGMSRKVGALTTFAALFNRNILYLLKNPKSLITIFFNAVFIGLLVLAVFWRIGNMNKYIEHPMRIPQNWGGFCFLLTNNLIISTTMAVII